MLVADSYFAYYFTLKMEAVSSSETSNFYQTARRLTAEASTLRNTQNSVLENMNTKPSDVTKLSERDRQKATRDNASERIEWNVRN